MPNRPVTTLFMLMSADGKITAGSTDELDFDVDFPHINGVKEGLHQYYEIERTTDLWSLNSGRVQAKVGVNRKPFPAKSDVNFVIIDNKHLNPNGVEDFACLSKTFVLVTTNASHPAFKMQFDNMKILLYHKLILQKMLEDLYTDFGCERITIQTGGTLNEQFLRKKLFDYVDIVVAPVLIGGKDTSTLIDGRSIQFQHELDQLGVLQLESCTALKDSYVRLRYKVIDCILS